MIYILIPTASVAIYLAGTALGAMIHNTSNDNPPYLSEEIRDLLNAEECSDWVAKRIVW